MRSDALALGGLPGLPCIGAASERRPPRKVTRIPVALVNEAGRTQRLPTPQAIVAGYGCSEETAEAWRDWLRDNRECWRHG